MFRIDGVGIIVLVIFAIVLPYFVGDYYLHVAIFTIWFIYLCLAWNISAMTGMICIAHTWFLGLGAYIPALLFIKLGISPWLGMPVGILGAAFFAFIIGYLPFRLRMPPLGFVNYTLALVFIAYHIAMGWPFVGRDEGLHLFFRVGNPMNLQWLSKLPYYYVLLAMAVLVGVVNWLILRSRMGLFLKAIKNNERVAAAAGVDVVRYKLLALMISAGLIAPAGILWGMYSRLVDPHSLLAVHLPIKVTLYTVIGGTGTFWGPILGAATLAPLTEVIRGTMGARYAGGDLIVIGTAIILFLVMARHGIVDWLRLTLQKESNIGGLG